MKVSAQPFEPPIAARAEDAADRARLEHDQHAVEGVTPITSVAADLNPATRESLSKLAQLIRSQMLAREAANDESREKSEERQKKERSRLSLVGATDPAHANEVARKSEESILQESVEPQAFPHVARAGAVLRAADRKRGQGVYGQLKTKAIFELVANELNDRAKAKQKTAA